MYLCDYYLAFDLECKLGAFFDIGMDNPVLAGPELCCLHLFKEGVEYGQLIHPELDVDIEVNSFPGLCLHRNPLADDKVD